MRPPFALRLAWRESRTSWRRLGVYMGAITLGVGALVAINSFRADLTTAIDRESRTLLGADLRLSSSDPFPDSVGEVLDSAAAAGIPVSTVTSMASVALGPGGRTRLVQLRAVTGDYPYYGSFRTDPEGLWGTLENDRRALVEPALLVALAAHVGDTLHIGESAFVIAGAITNLPADVSFRSAFGPRVYIAGRWLAETRLIGPGSMVRYEAFLRIADARALSGFIDRYRPLVRRQRVGIETAADEAEELAYAMDAMGRFLGLVGLTALLLGGLGVASAVNVFVKEKRSTIAVLRCLGARERTAFMAYLLQAGLLGMAGSITGVLLGLGLQAALPALLRDSLPVPVAFAIRPGIVLAGILMGAWVATIFALLPLLEIRGISPLRALRVEVQAPERRRVDVARVLVGGVLAGSIFALSIWQAPSVRTGIGFTTGLAVALVLLGACAWVLTRATRLYFPRRARFVIRQGVASLFRPHNQTAAITVALGFGVFLIGTLWIVQRNLLDFITFDASGDRPDLVAFDIQPDQRSTVDSVFRNNGVPAPPLTPIVTARIAALNGEPAASILARDRSDPRHVAGWALRREYRNSYRDTLTASEELVAGSWWDAPRPAGTPARISMEQDLAGDLGLEVGDDVTWDIQGVHIDSRIASLRRVDWRTFDTNFFVLFEPGVLERAPQSYVALARVDDDATRARIQRDLAQRAPNISTVDIAVVERTLAGIVRNVSLAIRAMALFSVAGGIIVLAGAVAASRYQRTRESVLLRTLGATRAQVWQVLLTEYAALGTLAGFTGAVLAAIASRVLVRRVFDIPFHLPVVPLLVLWAGVALLAVAIGLANSRGTLRRPPLAVLREAV